MPDDDFYRQFAGDRLSGLVNETLAPKSGEVNESITGHESLVQETRTLKNKLAAKRRETASTNNKFDTEVYGAAFYLAHALDFVLDAGVDVSKIDPETCNNENPGNLARDMFINSIKHALTHLGMDGNGVEEILKRNEGD